MLERLHCHLYDNKTTFFVGDTFQDFEYCQIEQIYVHNSFFNVSAALGNNVFYYEFNKFFILNDGYYDLNSLNRILKFTDTKYYKLILAYDSQTYMLYKFNNIADYNSEDLSTGIDKTFTVKDLTVLNRDVYNMSHFGPIRI